MLQLRVHSAGTSLSFSRSHFLPFLPFRHGTGVEIRDMDGICVMCPSHLPALVSFVRQETMVIVLRTVIVAGRLCNLSDPAPLNDSLSAWICDCAVCGFQLDAQVDEICKPDVCSTGPRWMALAPQTFAASLVTLAKIPRARKGSQSRAASALHNWAKCSLVDVSVTSHSPTCRGSALPFRCSQERKAGACCCVTAAAWHRPLVSNKASCSRKAIRRGCSLERRRRRAAKSGGWRPEKLRM